MNFRSHNLRCIGKILVKNYMHKYANYSIKKHNVQDNTLIDHEKLELGIKSSSIRTRTDTLSLLTTKSARRLREKGLLTPLRKICEDAGIGYLRKLQPWFEMLLEAQLPIVCIPKTDGNYMYLVPTQDYNRAIKIIKTKV